jgi:hypothetical protein
MAVYSRYPIDYDEIRTFQLFLWKDMPGALLPDDLSTPESADWYSPAELDVFADWWRRRRTGPNARDGWRGAEAAQSSVGPQ